MQTLCSKPHRPATRPATRGSCPSVGICGSRTARLIARAEGQQDSSDNKARPAVDWDGAWSSFQRQVRSQVEIKDTPSPGASFRPSASPRPRTQVRRVMPAADSWGGAEGERIRRAERVLVDIWSSADFLKAGTVASIILVVVFVLLVGPPPPDGRCTLYWC
ncbi:hypothetical protein HYH03_004066 [Edaphochlamys debaryana]|uniref:Uncharacterized protein n=1 Tax=Edaphochlamys debaryana TaxID=47281 RepID=A0A835YFH3_9CHLO|nr:hypothetical protein HYH03_004066 [Edaphochlamys debaryana]|eukprot:KAG2497795.1 hypothetical protein HYH03_004066 [Edaphochlamys debaryana]